MDWQTQYHNADFQCTLRLMQIARVLQATICRAADLVARYGGEEFAVILPETDQDGAERVAKTLMEAVRALALPHRASDIAQHITVSIGVASIVPLIALIKLCTARNNKVVIFIVCKKYQTDTRLKII